MVKTSYRIIFTLIKKVRGQPLEELANDWTLIMKTFDERQRMDQEALEKADKLINEAVPYLRIIASIDGFDCPKFIVGSNSIAWNALEIINPTVVSLCIKASNIHLGLHNKLELYNRICEAQIVLQQIENLYMIEEGVAILNEMKDKLAIALEQVNIFLPTSESTSPPVASHSSS